MIWTLILAGGSGSRLAEVNRRRFGLDSPIQFVDYDGRGSLLDRTLARANRWSEPWQQVVVTSRAHQDAANHALRRHPRVHRVEQPTDRGTTPGVLLPLLRVLDRDPAATVVLTPADHHVADEWAFARGIGQAVDRVERRPDRLVLLAVPPGEDAEGVWLLPDGGNGVAQVFTQPDATAASQLRQFGGLVSTCVLVARADSLAEALAAHAPGWWRALLDGHRDPAWLQAAYEVLPASDFAIDVLPRLGARLGLVALPAGVGWTAVADPRRLEQLLGGDLAS